MIDDLRKAALVYHSAPIPGKIGIAITKPTFTPEDLALAYTPGVAEPVKEIALDPEAAYQYTGKGNLVAVISNGTAVLGLGNVGALAGKPVMEGKAALFKHFAGIDVFDIEVDCEDPQEFIRTVRNIAPTFGGINLEDIKAPECFEITKALQEQLDIPVFHDDQDGTAIVIAAALLNALEIQQKSIHEVSIVCVGAGAAGIASMRLLRHLGVSSDKLIMVDRSGVVHDGRSDLNQYKKEFAIHTAKRSLADAMVGSDVFIGVSGPDILTSAMLASMALNPIVFALSNPTPEILPSTAHATRSDVIMATGRSDFPNQVNNALCFPYLFKGALQVRASCINTDMQIAAVEAIRSLTKEPIPEEVLALSAEKDLKLGPHYILPKIFDPRLNEVVSTAVANAAIKSGVARKELNRQASIA